MKGSAITGPVGKEAAELWPVSTEQLARERAQADITRPAYRVQLRRGDVNACFRDDSCMHWARRFSKLARTMTKPALSRRGFFAQSTTTLRDIGFPFEPAGVAYCLLERLVC